MVSGGWWKDSKGKFVRAGSSVRSFLVSNSQLQRRLGWSDKNTVESGSSIFLLPLHSYFLIIDQELSSLRR
jgi:hypothetical protein